MALRRRTNAATEESRTPKVNRSTDASVNKKNVRFRISYQDRFMFNGRQMVIYPYYNKSTSFQDWVSALRGAWKEILAFNEEEDERQRKGGTPVATRKHGSLKWKVFGRDNFTCQYCGSREDLEVDHIKPFSKGGKDILENLQTLCKPCNIRKSNKY